MFTDQTQKADYLALNVHCTLYTVVARQIGPPRVVFGGIFQKISPRVVFGGTTKKGGTRGYKKNGGGTG